MKKIKLYEGFLTTINDNFSGIIKIEYNNFDLYLYSYTKLVNDYKNRNLYERKIIPISFLDHIILEYYLNNDIKYNKNINLKKDFLYLNDSKFKYKIIETSIKDDFIKFKDNIYDKRTLDNTIKSFKRIDNDYKLENIVSKIISEKYQYFIVQKLYDYNIKDIRYLINAKKFDLL